MFAYKTDYKMRLLYKKEKIEGDKCAKVISEGK